MATQILMPALSPTMTEGTLARWLKNEGDKVASGDVLAEIETDKATMEVEAVDEGVLGKILIPGGTANVKVNEPIAILLADGESADAAPAPKAAPAAAPVAAPAPVAAAAPGPSAPAAVPASSAGRMVFATCSARAAKCSRVSAWGDHAIWPESSSVRSSSAPGAPPGSRVRNVGMPRAQSASASSLTWVVLPAPSPPSSVMKRPLVSVAP